MNLCKLALCQMPIVPDKGENLRVAGEYIAEAAGKGAELVLLPEMFNCPYSNACFPKYAEPAGGETWQFLSGMAKKHGIYLVGGSIPELCDGKVYNTSFVFNPKGEQIARHRKVHLFDIDVPGGQRFFESDTLSPGDSVTLFDSPWGKIAVAICFDIRFSEFFRLMGDAGAELICIPAAFNMTTGPAHWALTFRMRAIDQQCFVAGCSPARDEKGPYVAYGHSLVSDPWGTLLEERDEKAGVSLVEIDFDRNRELRAQIPIIANRRRDLYETVTRNS